MRTYIPTGAPIYNLTVQNYRCTYSGTFTPLDYSSAVNSIYGTDCIINKSAAELKTLIDANVIAMPTSGVLYFDSNSKFPRFKLSDSSYKRCIKVNKADAVIARNNIYTDICRTISRKGYNGDTNVELWQSGDILIDVSRARTDCNEFLKHFSTCNGFIAACIKAGYLAADAKLVYSGSAYRVDSKDYDFIKSLIAGEYNKKIVWEDDLNKAINKTLDKLDAETVTSINDMLKSTDSSVNDLGLKILGNYDSSVELTIKVLLSLNIGHCKRSKIWNSVAIKQLRTDINYIDPRMDTFPGCIANLNPSDPKYTANDVDLARPLIQEAFDKEFAAKLEALNHAVKEYEAKRVLEKTDGSC